MNRSRFAVVWICQLLLVCSLHAQELTLSPYSRYGIGDILSSTTTRNAGMGGIGIAADNYFSINRVNPASYGDLIYTTFDISAFGQFSRLRSAQSKENQFSAGFQDIAFGFPSNKNVTLVMGFAPFSAVGYNIVDLKNIQLGDSAYIQETQYSATGGINQAYVGGSVRMFKRKLRLGVNARYLFGNTQYNWAIFLRNPDSTVVENFQLISASRSVYIKGFSSQFGLIYQDTLNKKENILFRLGVTTDYSLNLKGDRVTEFDNGQVLDTTSQGFQTGDIVLPSVLGAGFMINKPGYWSVGMDVMYRNWENFQYFTDQTTLGKELRVAAGTEFSPNPQSQKFFDRVSYRLGAYWQQTYLQLENEPIQDYGVTVGVGIPAGLKGNSRLNQGRATSRINLSAELGRRGNVTSQPLEELYARIRLGFSLNDRWFIRRVVD
ncbi:MAG: hypothetical protein SF052_11940 [Bacteroidia bacterium]|nr:hypothetical protein [Bacteroidia bacterium]